MTGEEPQIALLDACVLVGIVRREMLLAAGRDGYYQPRWSDRIEDEWRRALLRQAGEEAGSGAEEAIRGEIALARLSFPNALVQGWEGLEGPLSLPDWDDRHVLAAAIAAKATVIVTDNLRDFPRKALGAHGVTPQPADEFLLGWAHARPASVRGMFVGPDERPLPALGDGPAEARARFKRARLPRFAKEVERLLSA
ncbi:MAG: PIN domain-containing protein [Neomegalonema sp.]|nr:PIN domain-containing protein [Neomegalonema sp.]